MTSTETEHDFFYHTQQDTTRVYVYGDCLNKSRCVLPNKPKTHTKCSEI